MTAPVLNSQMNKTEMTAWVAHLLQDMFELDAAAITPQSDLSNDLSNDLDIDSIDTVDIVVKLTQITGKRIQPEVFRNVRTVQDIVDVLTGLMEEKST